jgi:hypothetical protein
MHFDKEATVRTRDSVLAEDFEAEVVEDKSRDV